MSIFLGTTKIKKLYLGNIKIKNAYLGSTKVFGGSDTIIKGPTVDNLSQARIELAGGTIGDYAIFAGGRPITGSAFYNNVDAYNSYLVKTLIESLSVARSQCGATSVGDYLVVGTGFYQGGGQTTNTVDGYNSNLTKNVLTGFLESSKLYGRASFPNKYAVFAGGMYCTEPSSETILTTINVYDVSLTRSNPASLSVARSPGGSNLGNLVIFAGGIGVRYSFTDTVDFFDEDFVRTVGNTSVADSGYKGTSNSNYAIFFPMQKQKIPCYDTNKTLQFLTKPPSHTVTQSEPCTIGENVVFADGTDVYYYTEDLTFKQVSGSKQNTTDDYAATKVGDYGLLAGGRTNYSAMYATVESFCEE